MAVVRSLRTFVWRIWQVLDVLSFGNPGIALAVILLVGVWFFWFFAAMGIFASI